MIDVDDPTFSDGEMVGEIEYEEFLLGGDPNYAWSWPEDEWNACSLNYTSGTTGNLKVLFIITVADFFKCNRQCSSLGNASSSGLSLDAPDVSLQRLVLSMDRRGDGWNEYLFAPG